jgi:hypothetical protein
MFLHERDSPPTGDIIASIRKIQFERGTPNLTVKFDSVEIVFARSC